MDFAGVPALGRGGLQGLLPRAGGSVDVAGWSFWTYAGADAILWLNESSGAGELARDGPIAHRAVGRNVGAGAARVRDPGKTASHVEPLILRSSSAATMSR